MANHTKNIDRKNGTPNSINEMAAAGWTDRFDVDFSDIKDSKLTTDGDTLTLKLLTLPAGYAVKAACINVKTAFVTDGTLAASLGSTSDPDGLVVAQNIKTAGIKAPVAGFAPATAAGATGSDIVLEVATQASTGALSDISAGKLAVLLQIVDVR